MGKCSVCKKKIEYNQYKVIDGIVYCPNCIPEDKAKEVPCATLEEVIKANEEAEKYREEVEKEVLAAKEAEMTNATDTIPNGEMTDAIDTAPEPEDKEEKPKKKRGRKKQ